MVLLFDSIVKNKDEEDNYIATHNVRSYVYETEWFSLNRV